MFRRMREARSFHRKAAGTIVRLAALVLSVSTPAAAGAGTVLPISPTMQQTKVWCWAAVSEMALRYFGYGSVNPAQDFQCGVVAMLGGKCNANCYSCRTGISNAQSLAVILERYPIMARRAGVAGDEYQPRVTDRMTPNEIAAEIDEGDPVMAVINGSGLGMIYPPGSGEHVTLITGYENDGGTFRLVVNDPYPYASSESPNPFLAVGARMLVPGRYVVDYDAFSHRMAYWYGIYFYRGLSAIE